MAAKALKIDSLDLDLENPRITLATDQRDAMQKIIAEQKAKLINLAESIAVKGFILSRIHIDTNYPVESGNLGHAGRVVF
jgi:hypothetical protein